jgi:hypothetical protein
VRPRGLSLAVAAAAALGGAPRAAAQDSVFGIRGLGFLDRGVSANSAAMGGGLCLFDGASAVNPASLSVWHGTAGWAVGAGSFHSFDSGSGSTTLTATRFPLIGFAGVIGPRLVLGATISDYLDRNWSVTQAEIDTLRGAQVAAQDVTKSVGGVSDIRIAMAYRMRRMVLGVGLHVLSGSTQTSVNRQFPGDSAYLPFTQQQVTSYRGVGISFGAFASPVSGVLAAASVRLNGQLRASSPDSVLHVGMPVEANGGLSWTPMTGLLVAGTVGYSTWSSASSALQAAGKGRSRDVWSVGLGAEATFLRFAGKQLALRAGYRWRQLPFAVDTAAGAPGLDEHAVTGGLGFDTAGGRATVDAGLDVGSRAAGALTERFTTAYVGLTIRP